MTEVAILEVVTALAVLGLLFIFVGILKAAWHLQREIERMQKFDE